MCQICSNTYENEKYIQVCRYVKKLPDILLDVSTFIMDNNYKIGKISYMPNCTYFSCKSTNLCHLSPKLLPNVKGLNISFSKIQYIPHNMDKLELVRARGLKNFKYPEKMKDIVKTRMYIT